ncbi:hypothetical protein SCHIN_v1c10280 [Spiroplasma chinense]|uniref:Uncharacterized protein n=1 Tax=Spiroplasma chinense TaxID=216932 RepID=A0A5B9Y5A1_9MOLU|nr:lipoprotein [Spiroplasma chinense]QEH62221.1 hypothetical protein SCHIN_v1c10280 [Spiroplasma chinense]
MKKLLGLFAATSLSAISVSQVVSCETKYESLTWLQEGQNKDFVKAAKLDEDGDGKLDRSYSEESSEGSWGITVKGKVLGEPIQMIGGFDGDGVFVQREVSQFFKQTKDLTGTKTEFYLITVYGSKGETSVDVYLVEVVLTNALFEIDEEDGKEYLAGGEIDLKTLNQLKVSLV